MAPSSDFLEKSLEPMLTLSTHIPDELEKAVLERMEALGLSKSAYLRSLIEADLDGAPQPKATSPTVISDLVPSVLGTTGWGRNLIKHLEENSDQPELLARLLINLSVYLDYWGAEDFQLTSLRHFRHLLSMLTWVERSKDRDAFRTLLFRRPMDEKFYDELVDREREISVFHGPKKWEEWDEALPDTRSRAFDAKAHKDRTEREHARDHASQNDEASLRHFREQEGPARKAIHRRSPKRKDFTA